jgi:NAD(P) transhydrogenase subunit beta
MPAYLIELLYLFSGVLFIMGLRGMSHPETARRGMFYAEFGMLIAIVGTLAQHEIVRYDWIIAGLVIGSLLGLAMGLWVPMTAMPQRTAFSHAFGAAAAALVGVSEYYRHGGHPRSFQNGRPRL